MSRMKDYLEVNQGKLVRDPDEEDQGDLLRDDDDDDNDAAIEAADLVFDELADPITEAVEQLKKTLEPIYLNILKKASKKYKVSARDIFDNSVETIDAMESDGDYDYTTMIMKEIFYKIDKRVK